MFFLLWVPIMQKLSQFSCNWGSERHCRIRVRRRDWRRRCIRWGVCGWWRRYWLSSKVHNRNLLITEKGFWSVCKNIQKITLRTFASKTICFVFMLKNGCVMKWEHTKSNHFRLTLDWAPPPAIKGVLSALMCTGAETSGCFLQFLCCINPLVFENQSHSDLVSSGWPRHLFLRNWWLTADDASSVKILSLQKIPLIGGLQDVYRNLLITEKGFWSVCKNIQKITLRTFASKTICFVFMLKNGCVMKWEHTKSNHFRLTLDWAPPPAIKGVLSALMCTGAETSGCFLQFLCCINPLVFENQSHSDLVSSGWPRHLFLRNWWLTADDASSVKILSLQKIPLIGGLQDVYCKITHFWSF